MESEFEVHCNGEYVASACGPREDAWREAMYYVSQYSPDGEMSVFEVIRRRVALGQMPALQEAK